MDPERQRHLEKLDVYIHHYMKQRKMVNAAELFFWDADIPMHYKAPEQPLSELWSKSKAINFALQAPHEQQEKGPSEKHQRTATEALGKSTTTSSVALSSSATKEDSNDNRGLQTLLDVCIHDYILGREFFWVAELFKKEANVPDNYEAPAPTLSEWWSIQQPDQEEDCYRNLFSKWFNFNRE